MSNYIKPEGRKLNAKDVAERLLSDLNMNELLLWSPDLFAYTSYLMSLTGVYQLVVSPPKGKKWQPANKEIKEWLGINNTNKETDYHAVDSNGQKVSEKDYVEKSLLGISLKNWLLDFVRDSVTAEKLETLPPEEQKKWGGGSHFLTTSINDKVKNIITALLKSLSDIKLETNHIDNYKLVEEKYSPEIVRKKEVVSIGELFKYENEANWTQLVQGIGDSWRNKLNAMSNIDFYLINDAQLDKNGDPIYEDGKYMQWSKKAWIASNEQEDKFKDFSTPPENKSREEELLDILLNNTPPILIACWAFFYNKVNYYDVEGVEKVKLSISKLLCNRDDLQTTNECSELWKIAQSLLTMHAIADICCTKWGIRTVEKDNYKGQWFAERLLFDKGSLSTINPGRGRVIPKRHNPSVGITLRSISSNLGFHKSSVEVVWRKTQNTPLEDKIKKAGDTFSILLLPFPLDIKVKDFSVDVFAQNHVNFDKEKYGFFAYEPKSSINNNQKIIDLIARANNELRDGRFVDTIVFPEDALSKAEYDALETAIEDRFKDYEQYQTYSQEDKKAHQEIEPFEPPSLFIAGVRESRMDLFYSLDATNQEKYLSEEKENVKRQIEYLKSELESEQNEARKTTLKNELEYLIEAKTVDNKEFWINRVINFSRNAVYCKYYNSSQDTYTFIQEKDRLSRPPTLPPKFEQYKHHRWRLDYSQIVRYGLSQILDENKIWWEAIKIPKRRVSFLNVGEKITISHLVCEDLARQDPIADLIRHVGPSLVVTLLMDGPQLKSRWSSRYASILSDDPGSSVIALTSWGMTKRHSSAFGLMSKVIALWSETEGKQLREIELADGAEAVLLNLKLDEINEKTADGREERDATTVLRLLDVIQIYPDK